MADEHKLPAQIAARALAPAEQSGSLVARGLEAIKNRQRTLASVGLEADPEKSFREDLGANDEALYYMHLGNYSGAASLFREAADQGEVVAQFNLGLMYYLDDGVPQDYAEAIKWFRLAANQGHAEAQFKLGIMYEKRQGVSQDDATAVSWYRKAADQGHAGAQFNLGRIHFVDLNARPRLPHGVRLVHNEAHGGWVLLAPERLLKADAIAAEIIKRCNGEASVREMIDEFVQLYSAPREKITADVTMLLSTLVQNKLLDLSPQRLT
jgi:coenzyme PQQ biosynthesis protein PqqD